MMSKLLDLLFSPHGRINRAKIWLFVLVLLFGFVVAFTLFYLASALKVGAIAVLVLPIFLALLWALFATAIKRLHDRDYSGWMVVFFYVVPAILNPNIKDGHFVLSINITPNFSGSAENWILPSIAFLISAWGFVELFILRGTVGPNKYGPDPLDPLAAKAPKDDTPATLGDEN